MGTAIVRHHRPRLPGVSEHAHQEDEAALCRDPSHPAGLPAQVALSDGDRPGGSPGAPAHRSGARLVSELGPNTFDYQLNRDGSTPTWLPFHVEQDDDQRVLLVAPHWLLHPAVPQPTQQTGLRAVHRPPEREQKLRFVGRPDR